MSITFESDRALGFCVWVLKVDGLQAPPFDLHPDGDRKLRGLGLNEANWYRWVRRVGETVLQAGRDWDQRVEASVDAKLDELRRVSEEGGGVVSRLRATGSFATFLVRGFLRSGERARLNPVELWEGSMDVRDVLAELWRRYSREKWRPSLGISPGELTALRRGLGEPSFPRAYVYLVRYPAGARYRFSELGVVAGAEGLAPGADSLRDAILRAASITDPTS